MCAVKQVYVLSGPRFARFIDIAETVCTKKERRDCKNFLKTFLMLKLDRERVPQEMLIGTQYVGELLRKVLLEKLFYQHHVFAVTPTDSDVRQEVAEQMLLQLLFIDPDEKCASILEENLRVLYARLNEERKSPRFSSIARYLDKIIQEIRRIIDEM